MESCESGWEQAHLVVDEQALAVFFVMEARRLFSRIPVQPVRNVVVHIRTRRQKRLVGYGVRREWRGQCTLRLCSVGAKIGSQWVRIMNEQVKKLGRRPENINHGCCLIVGG